MPRSLSGFHRFKSNSQSHAYLWGAASLRARSRHAASGYRFVAPPPRLCTDNAAMIAWAGIERRSRNLVDGFDFAPRLRWPLDPDPDLLRVN